MFIDLEAGLSTELLETTKRYGISIKRIIEIGINQVTSLKNKKDIKAPAANLNENQKKFIEENLSKKNIEIAKILAIKKLPVCKYRISLIENYILGSGRTENTVAIASKFFVYPAMVSQIRHRLGKQNPDKAGVLAALGTREEILEKLTRGGKILSQLVNESGISNISRQAVQQFLAKNYGISASNIERTPEWYARKIAGGNEELATKLLDREFLEIKLLEESATALAGELGISSFTLKQYLNNQLGFQIKELRDKHRMVKLNCTQCGKEFFRPTRVVRGNKKRNPDKKEYCSRECRGMNIAVQFGFLAHPENAGKKRKTNQ